MKKILYILLIFLIPHSVFANTFIEKKIDGFTVRMIDYEIGNSMYDIKVVTSNTATDIESLLSKNGAITGVNGAFFCPSDYPECGGKSYTINERYVDGEKIATYNDTGARVVFGWDINSVPFLFQTGKINVDKEGQIYGGLANHPLILKDKQNQLEWYYDQGLIDKKMVGKMPRNFICSDAEKKHIYFGYVYNPTMDELVGILLKLGCSDALNLDAGKSASFEYNGRIIAKGDRDILDGVVLIPKNIDIVELDKKVERIFVYLTQDYFLEKKISQNKRKKILLTLSSQIDLARKKIYDANSSITYDAQTGEKNGYVLNITSSNVLKKVYLINRLQKYIDGELEKYF